MRTRIVVAVCMFTVCSLTAHKVEAQFSDGMSCMWPDGNDPNAKIGCGESFKFNIDLLVPSAIARKSLAACPAYAANLKRLIQISEAVPKDANGYILQLTDAQKRKRTELISAFEQYAPCRIENKGDAVTDELISEKLTPWVIARPDFQVRLLEPVPEIFPQKIKKVSESANQARGPRPVTIAGGLTIGSLFADDPIPKREEGNAPVYEIVDEKPIFSRKFFALIPGSVSPNLSYDLEITGDPADEIENAKPRQPIIVLGDLQTPEWLLKPKLTQYWFKPNEETFHLAGQLVQRGGLNGSQDRAWGLLVPNAKFKIIQPSIVAELWSYVEKVPGWIAVLEAALLPIVVFWRGSWLKSQEKDDDQESDDRKPSSTD